MATTKKNSWPIGRIGLAFFGGLLCCNPYFLIFALPLTLGSVVSLWVTGLALRLKILFTALPFLLPLAVYSLFFFH
jgi:hypothetical protein